MASRGGTSSLSPIDESRYHSEVLQLEKDETEESLDDQLTAEASELGLKIPDIQIAASLAATINAGFLDLTTLPQASSTVGSTRSSPNHPHSFADLVGSNIVSAEPSISLSDTLTSDHKNSSSIPSISSFSTQPSTSSSDARIVSPQAAHHKRSSWAQSQQIYIPGSPASSSASVIGLKLTEHRRSFIDAIGRPFRRRRMPSAINLPHNTHISLKKNESGGPNAVLVETKPVKVDETDTECTDEAQEKKALQIEVPVFDEAALRRSMEDAHLVEIFQRHKAQKSRFVRLQNELLDSLKAAHFLVIAEKKVANDAAEKEKEQWNAGVISRMEERQLSVEIDQMKEFEKSKQNSLTRIKYMERYVNTTDPHQRHQSSDSESAIFDSMSDTGDESSTTAQQHQRIVTRRQKERLAQEYLDRDSMDQLHEARIKVLRERQEKQLRDITAKLKEELECLVGRNTEAIAELERNHQRKEQEMLQIFNEKKNRLRRRWNIEEAIMRKKLETQNGVPYGPLPTISFSISDDTHSATASVSSDLLDSDIPILRNPFAKKDQL